MEKGFNTDIYVQGVQHHVQTEDWGFDNPWIVTRVFRKGSVVESVKIPYSEILKHGNQFLLLRNPEAMGRAIRESMLDQHRVTIKRLIAAAQALGLELNYPTPLP